MLIQDLNKSTTLESWSVKFADGNLNNEIQYRLRIIPTEYKQNLDMVWNT